VTPNPSRGPFTIELAGGPATRAPLEVVDVQGRRVALLTAVEPGRWTWSPGSHDPAGVYFLRLGAVTGRVLVTP
jgi:hypothetical protein